jgi:hypothetical protein
MINESLDSLKGEHPSLLYHHRRPRLRLYGDGVHAWGNPRRQQRYEFHHDERNGNISQVA